MAYREKYYHIYCDIHGDEFRISLRQWEYTGTAREVECGPEQFVVSQENSSNLLMGGLYPTKATVVFVSESGFDLEELYTANEKTYQLARLRNGQEDWIGNVVADGFTRQSYDDEKSLLTVVATDNLAVLKGIPFTDALGENYGNDGDYIKSFLWAIKEGLKKTGMNLRIWTFCDLMPISDVVKYSGTATLPTTSAPSSNISLLLSTTKSLELFNIIAIGDQIHFSDGALASMTYTITSKARNALVFSNYIVRLGVTQPVPILSQESVSFEILTQADTPNDDPLAITDHNVRVWIRDSDVEGKSYFEARGGAMMTWDVLDSIGKQWGVKIQQNQGHWEIRRWNADKSSSEGRQWFVYNSEGTFIGRQDMEQEVQIPCVATKTDYRLYGTSIKMDRVLNNVIVNYRYKYKQDGDSLHNLITNGSFDNGLLGWVTETQNYAKIASFQVIEESTSLSPGLTRCAQVLNVVNERYLAARDVRLTADMDMSVSLGDTLTLILWERITYHSFGDRYPSNKMGVYQIGIWSSANNRDSVKIYDLVIRPGNIQPPKTTVVNGQTTIEQTYEGSWLEKEGQHKRFTTPFLIGTGTLGTWRKITINIPSVPMSGFFVFEAIGVGIEANADIYYQIPGRDLNGNYFPDGAMPSQPQRGQMEFFTEKLTGGSIKRHFGMFANVATNTYNPVYYLGVTGVQLNRIVSPNSEAIPQIDPFMYPEMEVRLSREFTDTISEVEVLTGDDYGEFIEDRISGMSINGKPTSFWDIWDQRFGWSRQGLITAKSIIENYWKPTRLLTCEVSAKGIGFSSVFEFEEIPGKKFVILNGSIGGRYSSFSGVLKEIHDENDISLPPGGMDGNNTTDPYWIRTGTVRCVRDENGLNTGEAEAVEVNANPASSTYGQERWVSVGEDLNMCPIGEPIDVLWGEQDSLDVDNLRTEPLVKAGDIYSVLYNNDDSDVYLRFLHRASLGTIRSITYGVDYESISGWEYEPDVVIDGYTFKSIKLDWFTGVFQNVNVNFKIN